MLLWLALTWEIGIWLGHALGFNASAGAWILAAGLVAGSAVSWIPHKSTRMGWKIGAAAAAFVILGAARSWLAGPTMGPGGIDAYRDAGKATVSGWVADYPDNRADWLQLRVRAETVTLADGGTKPAEGLLLVRLPKTKDWAYGERLELTGELKQPGSNEEFSYRDYLAGKGIHTVVYYPRVRVLPGQAGSPLLRGIFSIRRHAYHTVNAIFPQPEAALLSGILLGLDNDLPEDLRNAFRDTGTAHIIAISGFNMSILATAMMWLLNGRVRQRYKVPLAAAVLILYTVLVGANPAVLRAAIMAVMGLGGRLIGRNSAGITPLVFTAALMTAFNPLLLWDVSFQLSFTATLGLITLGNTWVEGLAGWSERRFGANRRNPIVKFTADYILLTFAAQVMTLPVVLGHFHRLSLTALIVNPLILPVQPPVMVTAGVSAIAGMIWQPLGALIAWFAKFFASYTIAVVETFGQWRNGSFAIFDFGVGWVIASYLGIAAVAVYPRSAPKTKARLKPWLIPAGMMAAAAVAASMALRAPDGLLHVRLLQTSKPAALIVTPGGQQILLGAAPSALTLERRLSQSLGLWDRSLDGWIMPSTVAADVRGAQEVLENYETNEVLWAVEPSGSQTVGGIVKSVGSRQLQAGERLPLEGGAELQVLAGDGKHALVSLRYGHFCAVWINSVAESELLPGEYTLGNCYLVGDEADQQNYAGILSLGWIDAGTPVHWVTDGARVFTR